MTNIKKLERDSAIQQRLAAVGEMAAGIAHEIRNPLASMSGSIQILRQELPLSSEQEQLMDIVLRESERLNTTIRSFLAYARPQRFQIERFDLRRSLHDAALLLRNSPEVHEGHEILVDVPTPSSGARLTKADQAIVWNLATNGSGRCLDRTPASVGAFEPSSGGRPDRARRRRRHPPGSSNGCSSRSGTFAHGGGLGLAIVHRIVTDYNGNCVSSSPASASVSCLPGAHGSGLMSTALQPDVRRRPAARILVVDDEHRCASCSPSCCREGYEVLLAENGAPYPSSSASRSTC